MLNPVPGYGVKAGVAAALSIGKLAAAAGVNVETIRYYQRRGLLALPARPLGGQRRYSGDAAKRVRFIKRAQALGFTLDEIATLLSLDRARACTPTRALAAHKRDVLPQKIADLTALDAALADLIRRCDGPHRATNCPIIETLAGSDGPRAEAAQTAAAASADRQAGFRPVAPSSRRTAE